MGDISFAQISFAQNSFAQILFEQNCLRKPCLRKIWLRKTNLRKPYLRKTLFEQKYMILRNIAQNEVQIFEKNWSNSFRSFTSKIFASWVYAPNIRPLQDVLF